ncbi:LysR family transcriptional regulator [Lachnospiraceae bacterium]|nr:LysR family transcriptional regulator [Lachnospiraceae bacterium]
MVDSRIYTFLEVCRTLNYTKASANLHITQPAVSQHVRYLEDMYQVPLVEMRGKKVCLTKQGELLGRFAASLCADEQHIREALKNSLYKKESLVMGATLTVGEFVIPSVLGRYLLDYPDTDISVTVKNTESLLKMLEAGEIEFAVVEGRFDKSAYSCRLVSKENFIGICGGDFYEKYCKRGGIPMEVLFENRLIVREKGSGTRGILEQFLQAHNQSLDKFKNRFEVSNMGAIRRLVAGNCGISFLYEAAVEQELGRKVLYQIPVDDFQIQREFNFVYLKNSIFSEKYDKISKYFDTWRGSI